MGNMSNQHLSLTNSRATEEHARWVELKALAESDDVAGFMRRYGDYLEWNSLFSPGRQCVYRMVRRAQELLTKEKSDG